MIGFAVFFVVALVACLASSTHTPFERAFKSDYAALVETIKTKVNAGLQRIKKFL